VFYDWMKRALCTLGVCIFCTHTRLLGVWRPAHVHGMSGVWRTCSVVGLHHGTHILMSFYLACLDEFECFSPRSCRNCMAKPQFLCMWTNCECYTVVFSIDNFFHFFVRKIWKNNIPL
jgi:hypothetical protein